MVCSASNCGHITVRRNTYQPLDSSGLMVHLVIKTGAHPVFIFGDIFIYGELFESHPREVNRGCHGVTWSGIGYELQVCDAVALGESGMVLASDTGPSWPIRWAS